MLYQQTITTNKTNPRDVVPKWSILLRTDLFSALPFVTA